MLGVIEWARKPGPGSRTSTRIRSELTRTARAMVAVGGRPAWRTLFVTSSLTSRRTLSRTAGATSPSRRASCFRARLGPSGRAGRSMSIVVISDRHLGWVIDELEPFVEERDEEDPVDGLRTRNDGEAPTVASGTHVRFEDQAKAGGIHER